MDHTPDSKRIYEGPSMKDQHKTKKQLLEEVEALHNQLVKLKKGKRKHKEVENALKKSEERYRRLVEGSPVIVWSLSDKCGTLFVSSRVKSILGYSPDFLYEKPWLWNKSIHPDDQYAVAQSIKDFATGKDLNVEYRIKDSSGNWRWFHDRSIGKRTEDEATVIEGISIDITERKQAEDKIRESKQLLEKTFAGLRDALLVIDGNTLKILDCNPAASDIFGYDRNEMIGQSVKVLHVDKKTNEEFRSHLFAAVETKGYLSWFEFKMKRKDGVIFPTEHNVMLIEDEQGNRIRWVSMVRDITERKRAEEELRRSEERMKSIFRAAPIGIGVVTNRVLMDVNARICEMTGYSREELVGSSARVLYPTQDDFDYVGREKYGQIAEKGMGSVETRWIKKDGTIIDVLLSSTPIDPSDLSHGVTFTALDITERKRAEQALRESEERFRLAFENANTGVCLVDLDGNLTRVNNKMCETFGYTKEELERMTVNDIAHPEDIDKSPEFIQKTLRGEIDRSMFEKRYLHKKGHVVTCQVSSSLVRGANGSPLYFISHVHDITDRKQAEAHIRESQQRFQGLVETLSDWIWEVDQNGIYTYVSPKVKDLLGYDPEEVLGKTPFDLMEPEEAERVKDAFESLLSTRQPLVALENVNRHKDGHMVMIETSGIPFFDAEGRFKGYRGVDRDITGRKQTEEALKERQETIKAIIETSQDWIWAIDHHGMHTYSNPAIERILGYGPEEIVGRSSLDVMHEDDKKMVESILRDSEEKRCGWNNLLLRWRHKNGTYRYLESNAVPILNAKGDLVGFQGVDRDITERKKAEEALQKEREISLSILENAPYGVALIDKGGEYVYINPEFTNITGYALQDIPTGKDWFQKAFSNPKDRERMIQVWKKDRSKGNMINREFSINRKDGKTNEIETRSTFLRDGRAVMVLHDTTEQKRAEEEMKSLQEQLRQSQKMEAIGRLAGGIAHDFNNLLTIIKGYSQLSLIELKEDTPLKGNIEHIHTATDRAADLVRQLLAFSRRQILEMKAWDLNTILTNLQNMLRRLIGEDIKLTTILAEDLGRVKTDLGWIEQAIMNLVVNARDAMPSGGKLTIETGNAVLDEAYVSGRVGVKPGRYVMFSVSDTGVGMTPEVRERLFEPFFSTKEKDKGTGLGLSTVYGIVKQSDGDIWVYSEPGKGSTFKIYLPRVDEPPEQLREKVSGDELLRGSETILLVEDEEEVRKLAVRVLERQGYKVLAARDGDEALLICEGHQDPIHLMLTDVVMPGMNGYELAERLESLHPRMKVLYMSGYTDNAIVLHGVLVEGVNYIQKPFTVDALTKKVREVLEQ